MSEQILGVPTDLLRAGVAAAALIGMTTACGSSTTSTPDSRPGVTCQIDSVSQLEQFYVDGPNQTETLVGLAVGVEGLPDGNYDTELSGRFIDPYVDPRLPKSEPLTATTTSALPGKTTTVMMLPSDRYTIGTRIIFAETIHAKAQRNNSVRSIKPAAVQLACRGAILYNGGGKWSVIHDSRR